MASEIFITVTGIVYLLLSLQYPLGALKRPGSGALPVLLGSGLAIVGLVLCIQSLRVRLKSKEVLQPWKMLKPALLVTSSLICYVLIWPILGTVLASFFLFFLLSKVMGAKGWLIPGALAGICALVLFWAFSALIMVPLPEGIGFFERLIK